MSTLRWSRAGSPVRNAPRFTAFAPSRAGVRAGADHAHPHDRPAAGPDPADHLLRHAVDEVEAAPARGVDRRRRHDVAREEGARVLPRPGIEHLDLHDGGPDRAVDLHLLAAVAPAP